MIYQENFKFSKVNPTDKAIHKETLVQLLNYVNYYLEKDQEYTYCPECQYIFNEDNKALFKNPFRELPYKLQKYYKVSPFKCKDCEVYK